MIDVAASTRCLCDGFQQKPRSSTMAEHNSRTPENSARSKHHSLKVELVTNFKRRATELLGDLASAREFILIPPARETG